jgi:hypothetical protein
MIIDNTMMNGVKVTDASGKIGNENLTKPYVPIFKSTAAKITEPMVGA